MSFLELKSVSVNVEKFCLKNISFELNKGEYLSIIGPSGAGKTVLLKSIMGLYKLDQGEVILNSNNIENEPIEKRRIAIVFQALNLFPHLSVFENIDFGLRRLYSDRSERTQMIAEIADEINISHLLKRKIHNLSGGEKQRIALGRALITKPDLLLLDEPFSALDSLSRKCLQRTLKDVAQKFSTTIIEVSHNLEDTKVLADKIGFLINGQLLQFGYKEEVFDLPQSRYIANFMNTSIYPAKVIAEQDNQAVLLIGDSQFISIDIAKKSEVEVAIRPENFVISKNKSSQNCFRAEVIKTIIEGDQITLVVQNGKQKFIIRKNLAVINALKIREGESIFCSVSPQNVRILSN